MYILKTVEVILLMVTKVIPLKSSTDRTFVKTKRYVFWANSYIIVVALSLWEDSVLADKLFLGP